jgi:cytidine deaminase
MLPEPHFLDTAEGFWVCLGLEDSPWLREQLPSFALLLERAREAKARAHAPYSGFAVGSAVLMDGMVFVGCNVENASYGATLCAERIAIASAVATGKRSLGVIAVSTSASPGADLSERSPCGLCRQVMGEFASDKTLVVLDAGSDSRGRPRAEVIAFDALLPWRFRLRG